MANATPLDPWVWDNPWPVIDLTDNSGKGHLLDLSEIEVVDPVPTTRAVDGTRRAFDFMVALTGSVITMPVWLIIALMIRVLDPGPVLFGHQRIGRNGRPFTCYKFRSMRVDADKALAELLATDPEAARQWAVAHKLDNDPRVSPIGRWIRRFDLDELPQLLNVLRGEMSIVGPRPVVSDELPKFGRHLATVLSVKPGLTGKWQVSGRNSMSYDERVQAEADYVASRTLLSDLLICLRTPRVLVRSNNDR